MKQNVEKKDLFTFDNQGQNYDLSRPDYSPLMIQTVLDGVQFGDYLDIGTGTGLVFCKIQHLFKGLRVAQDISQKQLDVLREKFKDQKDEKIQIIHGDAANIIPNLEQAKLPIKYDLITIGQALHWFEFDSFIEYVRNNLMKDTSILAILSYYAQDVLLDVKTLEKLENRELNSNLQDSMKNIYNESFDSIVKPYYDCDRDNLGSGYEGYNFKKYFNEVKKTQYDVYAPKSLEQVIAYLKSCSAYNVYRIKFKDDDPIQKFEEHILEKYNQIRTQQQLKTKSPPLLLYTKYFTNIMRK